MDKTNLAARNPHLGGTINPFATKNDASRNAMWSTNQPQTVPLIHSDPKQISNGADIDLKEAVWDVRAPVNLMVLKIIERIKNDVTTDQYIIYKDMEILEESGEEVWDVLHIPSAHMSHVRYGFTYQKTSALTNLEVGQVVRKDTIFATSPNVKLDGQYGIGKESNFAFIGSLITHEDGVGMCEEDRYAFQSTYYSETTLTVSEDEILLNLYGTDNLWKPFPRIGHPVRSDGLLCVSRKIRKRFKPLQVNRISLKDNISVFDKPRYILPANDVPDGHGQTQSYSPVVVDIKVIKNTKNKKSRLPKNLNHFLNSIWEDDAKFYRTILSVVSSRNYTVRLAPALELLETTAAQNLDYTLPKDEFGNFKHQINRKVIDEYEIKITTRSTLIPTIGYKYTDLNGGKYVVCGLYPKKDCPTDQWGRHATFWASPESVSNRNNPGQLHEMIYSDSAFHTKRYLLQRKEEGVSNAELWNDYYQWVSLISEDMKTILDKLPVSARNSYIDEALATERLGVYITNESRDNGLTLLDKTEGTPYYPPRGPITYRDDYGVLRTTKANIRISNKYIVLLEKDGGYFSAVSAPKRGPMGISAKLSSDDKKTTQLSEQSARVGESELRNMICYITPEATARYFAQSNSAVNLKYTIDKMLLTDTPSYLPEGGGYHQPTTLNRGVEIFHHYLNCFGVEVTNQESNN